MPKFIKTKLKSDSDSDLDLDLDSDDKELMAKLEKFDSDFDSNFEKKLNKNVIFTTLLVIIKDYLFFADNY